MPVEKRAERTVTRRDSHQGDEAISFIRGRRRFVDYRSDSDRASDRLEA